tara:strand:+ start:213 stop:860 length:648 start_codon:yes stop_codon:yes gene_type:complete
MAFTDSLPASSAGYQSDGSTGDSNCSTTAANTLADDGTVGLIRQVSNLDGSANLSTCYAPKICEVTRFEDITIPAGATITGVRFTVDARAALDSLSTGLEYQISVNSGTDFTTAAALDLTGANNLKGSTSLFHTTSSETELHGLTWPSADSGYDSSAIRFRWSLNSGEGNGKAVEIDFIKLRVYYSSPSQTYDNSSDEQVVSLGTLVLGSGEITF